MRQSRLAFLESAEEQIAAIGSQPLDKQNSALHKLIADPEKSVAEFIALTNH